MVRHRRFNSRPRCAYAIAEALESRRMLSGDDILIDNGPIEPAFDPDIPPAFRIVNRWTSTATGSVGTQGNGLTLTWSVVPDGTVIPGTPSVGDATAPSDLQSRLNGIYGSPLNWMPLFQQVFDSWSKISGITFVQDNDDGAAYAAGQGINPGVMGVRGDIRIGAHLMNGPSGVLAYNYYPNDGDMVIDSGDFTSLATLLDTSNNSRKLRNTMAHELGHGLGFNHVDPLDNTKLMEAFLNTNFDGPQFDEKYTVNRNYGDVFEKGTGNNLFTSASDRGTLGGITETLTDLSISNNVDNDFFKFTLDSTRNATVTVAPTGLTYLEGPYTVPATPPTSFNAQNQVVLQVQILASNGTTVLGTGMASGLGQNATLTLNNLAAGIYYIKVTGTSGTNNQMYTLTNTVSGTPVSWTTATLSAGDLVITDMAANGKADNLTVVANTALGRYEISDPGYLISTAIVGSGGTGTNFVTVPFSQVVGGDVFINTMAGNDSINVTSASVPFTIDAGAGTDTVTIVSTTAGIPVSMAASLGNDTINVNTDNSGTAAATFPVSQTIGTLNIGSGGLATLSGVVNGSPEILVVKGLLNITGTGKLDLKNNDLALSYYLGSSPVGVWNVSNYTGVLGLVKSGRNGGAWTGNGLITTQSAAVGTPALTTLGVAEASQVFPISGTQTATFDLQTVDASTVLVKYTFAGDATLTNAIDGDDYVRVDTGFASGLPRWHNGDFNYSGTIDADDYFVIDSNYAKDTAVLSGPPVILAASAPGELLPPGVFAAALVAPESRRLVDDLL